MQYTFNELFRTQHSIIQAPMAGGATTPELVAAVSNAGALGSLGAAYMTPEDLRTAIHAIKNKTNQPFQVNLFTPPIIPHPIPDQSKMCSILNKITLPLSIQVSPTEPPYIPSFDEQFTVIIEENVPIFSFTFGLMEDRYIQALKKNNIKIIGTATSISEAQTLEKAGINAVVAQGIEAGGHRGTFSATPDADEKLSTKHLVKKLKSILTVPIIAAGGIGHANDVNEAISSGASACQIGTAFLTTKEAGTHAAHKKTLLNTHKDETILTRAFSGRYARAIRNKFTNEMTAYEGDILPFPIQNKLSKTIRQASAQQNNPEYMSLWAGQNAIACKEISATELVSLLAGK